MKKILFVLLTLCCFSGMAHGDLTWTSPTQISTALTNASNPHVVIDSSNNITAAWIESGVIKSSSLPSGGSWSSIVTLSNVANTSTDLKLGIDGSGNVTALWIENLEIESATRPSGGSWAAETSPISSSGAANPSLAVDNSGNAVAVWTRSGFIESSTRISGTWSLVSVLSASGATNPSVAISSIGKAMAVWHGTSSGSDIIVTDILTISSNTWAATKNVFTATAAFSHNYPKVALDANGNASVAWFRYNFLGGAYQNVQVVTSALAAGGTAWGIPSLLSSAGYRNPADLTIKIAYDSEGNALTVWTNSYDGETFYIESARLLFGGAWSSSTIPGLPTIYSLAFDFNITPGDGTVLLTSMGFDGISSIQIQSQTADTTNPIEQFYTIINPISTGTSNGYPKCGLSIAGSTLNAVAVWIHFDGTNNVIHTATGTDSVIPPPSSVSASQGLVDFGVYQNYQNTITWAASSAPDLIQYDIYRNGIYFNATAPGTLILVDNNAINGGTVTYGVAALTSELRQSVIVTFTLFP